MDEIEKIRNASGGKYYICSLCGDVKQVGEKKVFADRRAEHRLDREAILHRGGGIVVNARIRDAEAVKEMDLSDIVLETDCPYLTPAPHRGKRNESAYVSHICDKVAELKGVEPDEVARITSQNARRMFLSEESA